MSDLKVGDHVKIGPKGNKYNIEQYSSYVGWQGTLIKILDETYALVDLPEKYSIEHRSPVTKVPLSQLIKL